MRDEYGTTTIMASGPDHLKLIDQGKTAVTEENMNNALSADEKKRNWTHMFIELIDPGTGELIEDAVYAGIDNTGKPAVQPLSTNAGQVKLADCDCKVRAFIGKLDKKDVFATTERGQLITDAQSNVLEGKTLYYVRRGR
jgi:hypothetical protein